MKTIQIATITGLVAVFALAIAPSIIGEVYAKQDLLGSASLVDDTTTDVNLIDEISDTTFDPLKVDDADMNVSHYCLFHGSAIWIKEPITEELTSVGEFSLDFSDPEEFEFQYSYEPVTEMTLR